LREIATQTAKLWRKFHLTYDQSKHGVEQTRHKLGLEAPRERRLFNVNYFFSLTTTISPYRVASTRNVTELVIVVGGRPQKLADVLLGELIRLDAVG
jgi:hypothetical protein